MGYGVSRKEKQGGREGGRNGMKGWRREGRGIGCGNRRERGGKKRTETLLEEKIDKNGSVKEGRKENIGEKGKTIREE